MKKCPLCIEDINDDAQVCKHCGADMKSLGFKKSLFGSVTQALFARKAEDIKGVRLKYKISFRSCQYRWLHPNALFDDMINSALNNSVSGTVRDWFFLCPELKSFIEIGIHTVESGKTGIDYINAKADEMRESLADSSSDSFKMIEVENSNPFTHGVLIRAKGKNRKGELQDKLHIAIVIHEVLLVLTLHTEPYYGDFAFEDFMKVYNTFAWDREFLIDVKTYATPTCPPWGEIENSEYFRNYGEQEHSILKEAYFRKYKANGTLK